MVVQIGNRNRLRREFRVLEMRTERELLRCLHLVGEYGFYGRNGSERETCRR